MRLLAAALLALLCQAQLEAERAHRPAVRAIPRDFPEAEPSARSLCCKRGVFAEEARLASGGASWDGPGLTFATFGTQLVPG